MFNLVCFDIICHCSVSQSFVLSLKTLMFTFLAVLTVGIILRVSVYLLSQIIRAIFRGVEVNDNEVIYSSIHPDPFLPFIKEDGPLHSSCTQQTLLKRVTPNV